LGRICKPAVKLWRWLFAPLYYRSVLRFAHQRRDLLPECRRLEGKGFRLVLQRP
jgi:hypothetical protein